MHLQTRLPSFFFFTVNQNDVTTQHQSLPCFYGLSVCVSFRGPRRSPWGFLWLLRGALSRRHLRGDPTKADLVLRPQSAHPLRAALLNDSAGFLAACKLGGEDQPGWELIGWQIKCCFVSPSVLGPFPGEFLSFFCPWEDLSLLVSCF